MSGRVSCFARADGQKPRHFLFYLHATDLAIISLKIWRIEQQEYVVLTSWQKEIPNSWASTCVAEPGRRGRIVDLVPVKATSGTVQ